MVGLRESNASQSQGQVIFLLPPSTALGPWIHVMHVCSEAKHLYTLRGGILSLF